MRFRVSFLLLLLLLALAAISLAGDTDFAAGPQYLITNGSPMFLRPIATPSLSFNQPLPPPSFPEPEATSEPTYAVVPTDTYLSGVYWGQQHTADEILARRVSTPSRTAEETVYYAHATANLVNAPSTEAISAEAAPVSSVIEITSAILPANLPASILDTGVTALTDPQSLRDRGYGVSLGETAAYWKAHKLPAPRLLTNQDLPRK